MKTHKGELVSDTMLTEARRAVAEDWRTMAYDIRVENAYASHITEEQKIQFYQDELRYADEIERGEHDSNFTIWQRLNTYITGECIAFLS